MALGYIWINCMSLAHHCHFWKMISHHNEVQRITHIYNVLKRDFSPTVKRFILEKWFPLQGERAHSLNLLSFQDQNREVGGQNINNRPINLLKVITFSTDYKYTT